MKDTNTEPAPTGTAKFTYVFADTSLMEKGSLSTFLGLPASDIDKVTPDLDTPGGCWCG